ncbi:HTH-type transcriptional regulator YesS [compost metagenome]
MNRLIANRGLLQIFCSLLLVIVIMFVANYFVYKNSISGIYEKVTQNNRLVVKNIIQSFDSSFTTVNNLIFTIHGLPYDSLKAKENERIDMAQAYMLQNNLAALVSSVDYIEDVIVYYDNVNLAITANGTSDMTLLFHNKYRHDIYNADYWRTFAKSKHPFTVFPTADFFTQTEGSKTRSQQLMVVMGGNKYRLSDKNVIVLINVEKLMKHINLKSMIPGSSLIVLDADRKIILSTEKDWGLVEVLNDVYFNHSQESSLTRGNYEYSFYQSDYNSFIYIDKVPYQFQNIDSVSSASRIIMISAIISAVLLSALLSVYLYMPVKGLLRLLGGGRIKGNDFRKIHSGIVKVQMENDSLKKQMEFVDMEIRRGVFLQALDDVDHSREYELQMQKYYSYFFPERQFVMASVHFKRLDETEDLSSLRIEEMTEEIRKGLQSLLGHVVVFHARELQFLLLIGIEPSSSRQSVLEGIESFVKHTAGDSFPGYSLRACVSKMYESKIKSCSAAYRDILNGHLYRNVNDQGRDVVDTELIHCVVDIHFPLEKMDKLSHCLIGGRTEEGTQIVTAIIQENVSRNIHHHHLAHIAKSIFLYIIKPIAVAAADDREFFRLETEFMGKVDHAFSHHEIEDALAEVVHYIANKRKYEQKSKLNPAFISQYIELHYMNNLYLDHMAEVLDTSPKYFSNYFKKTFGINYVDYLNKVRLTHARELLKDSEYNIAEIGEKTGYMNASTFTTTFKKYYGISPSEYRKKAGDG